MKLLPYDYAVRNLGRSPLRLVATVGGCALVVLIMTAAAAFVQGMRRSLTTSPQDRTVLLMGAGSEESLERSQISASVPTHVQAGVQGLKQRLGQAFVSPEVHMAMEVARPEHPGETLRALLRGVTPAAYVVHTQARIAAGRAPRSGQNELAVGRLVANKLDIPLADLALGRQLVFEGQAWTIVGQLEAPGTVIDAEIWAGLTDLQVAAQRDTLSCVAVTLDQAELADLEAWTAVRLDLELVAISAATYYASIQRFYRPVRAMIWTTALLISLAGVLGGLNTFYAAFAARTREIGMLRSLGFPRYAILICLVQESLLAAASGALLGCLLSLLVLHGRSVRFSMGVFELQIDAVAALTGIGCGLLLGLVGALPPAIRCLRLPIASALRTG